MKYIAVFTVVMMMLIAVGAREKLVVKIKEDVQDAQIATTTTRNDDLILLENTEAPVACDEKLDSDTASKIESLIRHKRSAEDAGDNSDAVTLTESALEEKSMTTVSPVETEVEEKNTSNNLDRDDSFTTNDPIILDTSDILASIETISQTIAGNQANSTTNSTSIASGSTSVPSSTGEPTNDADDSNIATEKAKNEEPSATAAENKSAEVKETTESKDKVKKVNSTVADQDQSMSETIAMKNMNDLNVSTPRIISPLNSNTILPSEEGSKRQSAGYGEMDKRSRTKIAETDMDPIDIIPYSPLHNQSATLVLNAKPTATPGVSSTTTTEVNAIEKEAEIGDLDDIDMDIFEKPTVEVSAVSGTTTTKPTTADVTTSKVSSTSTEPTTTKESHMPEVTVSATNPSDAGNATTVDTMVMKVEPVRSTTEPLVNELTSEKSVELESTSNSSAVGSSSSIDDTSSHYVYALYDESGVPCILTSMDVILSVSYYVADDRMVTKKMKVPDAAAVSGNCSRENTYLALTWKAHPEDKGNNKIEFHVTEDGEYFYVNHIQARVFLDEDDVPSTADHNEVGSSAADLRLFSASMDSGIHVCRSVTEVQCGTIVVTIKDVSFIAYNDKQDTSFRKEEYCPIFLNLQMATLVGSGVGITVIVAIVVMLIWFKSRSSKFRSELP